MDVLDHRGCFAGKATVGEYAHPTMDLTSVLPGSGTGGSPVSGVIPRDSVRARIEISKSGARFPRAGKKTRFAPVVSAEYV